MVDLAKVKKPRHRRPTLSKQKTRFDLLSHFTLVSSRSFSSFWKPRDYNEPLKYLYVLLFLASLRTLFQGYILMSESLSFRHVIICFCIHFILISILFVEKYWGGMKLIFGEPCDSYFRGSVLCIFFALEIWGLVDFIMYAHDNRNEGNQTINIMIHMAFIPFLYGVFLDYYNDIGRLQAFLIHPSRAMVAPQKEEQMLPPMSSGLTKTFSDPSGTITANHPHSCAVSEEATPSICESNQSMAYLNSPSPCLSPLHPKEAVSEVSIRPLNSGTATTISKRPDNILHARTPLVLVALTFCFMISLAVTIPLRDVINSDILELVELIEICIVVLLGYCLVLIYWDYIHFYLEHSLWLQAMINLSVVGYVVFKIIKYLHPSHSELKERLKSKYRNYTILDHMIVLIFVIFLVVVLMASVLVALFAELSGSLRSLDVAAVFILYILISHFVMVNPFLSASVIDACGGFMLIQVLQSEGYEFAEGLFIILATITILHFTGSCCQWLIGKISSVQLWLNQNGPVLMLTASDSVYVNAGIWKAGLIGGIFPDTINGLNQGRMGMDCWIQFWSEWSALPNCIALTIGGALLGSSNQQAYNALPLVGLVALIMNVLQGMFAMREFSKVFNDIEFWTAFEKWTVVHHFVSLGYLPTKKGWEKDVYSLAKRFPHLADDSDFEEPIPCLYDKMYPVYFSRKKDLLNPDHDPIETLTRMGTYTDILEKWRNRHLNLIEANLRKLVDKGYLTFDESRILKEHNPWWMWKDSDLKDSIPQAIIVVLMALTAGGSFYCLRLDDWNAVEVGFEAITGSDNWEIGFVLFILHWIIAGIYWYYIVRDYMNPWTCFSWCRRSDASVHDLETTFETIAWEPQDKNSDRWRTDIATVQELLSEEDLLSEPDHPMEFMEEFHSRDSLSDHFGADELTLNSNEVTLTDNNLLSIHTHMSE